MSISFYNRTEAGKQLADKLNAFKNRQDVLVLALPRGGVPVAFEIATKLNLPLNLCLVRKLGVPHHPELAMGAIASDGVRILNQDIVNWLNISPSVIEQVAQKEEKELQRRDRAYRGNKPYPEIRHQTVILVDDGIATGSTIKAAISAIKSKNPQQIILAVPVVSASACQMLGSEVEQIICLEMPRNLRSISLWYDDFSQTSDQEVCDLLARTTEKSMVN